MADAKNTGIRIGRRSFLLSLFFMFLVMVLAYVLTLVVPGGQYARTVNADGTETVDLASGFTEVQGGISFWKWLASPVLVLGAKGSSTLIAVLLFLVLIGGVFNSLNEQGIMSHMLTKLVRRFSHVRYRLMAAMILFFMAMGAFIGSFEEVIPLVPIVVALAVGLGWDIQTGIAMSLLAVGCGFASGVANPFTVGVAQTLAGLPMLSGMWFRAVGFVLIYLLLFAYVYRHAKKVGKKQEAAPLPAEEAPDPKMDRGVRLFSIFMGIGILLVVVAGFVPGMGDYTMVILCLTFLTAGSSAVLASGMGLKNYGKSFLKGIVAILPSILLVLMASSVRYIMEEGMILDSILRFAVETADGMPKAVLILFIYLICLVANFFVPSGSAEAILLIPLITPLAAAFGVSAQLCVLAFAFGDGFSNIFYPTNAALLIALGLGGCGYGKWIKYSMPFQLLNLVLTCGVLLFGLAVGFA